MKEPLRMIGSFSDLIRRQYGDVLDAEGLEFLDIITDANERMSNLLNRLLDYAKLDTEDKTPGRVELEELMLVLGHRMAGTLKARQASLEFGPLHAVQGYREELNLMLEHLLDNAIKFQPPGQSPAICVLTRQDASGIWLEVHDNGIGVSAAHRKEVFDLFRRLHPRCEYPGSGIGLAIVQRVVELHNGRCEFIESRLGGAAFCALLPVSTA
jgi:signal transduction histidine kinase